MIFNGETITIGQLGEGDRWEESGKISFWDVSFGMDLNIFLNVDREYWKSGVTGGGYSICKA